MRKLNTQEARTRKRALSGSASSSKNGSVPGPMANGQRVVLNLIDDVEFRTVLELGLAEYIGRYKKPASTKNILPEALDYVSRLSGDELWRLTYDKYTYDQQKRQGINLDPKLNAHLQRTVEAIQRTCADKLIRARWNKRMIAVAALYLYCLYLIAHNGNRYMLPAEQAAALSAVGR
ncbi:hypothetical protein [Asticcacaulis excentricus]|uniref:Uncharacterized protein n=1 Tax=Asticcacaulis excentricus (strain ATCC 15261 / DSM 4724 / KCTC 12464 / NCIMB 9791 / VKM B-1370 / CB 48) TaxID=573065 RepID=E8RVW9_ASTEC|nr:hypothetical protein [Asticcacaulis excentricus]ADU15391.1 hypothetical protein Astex_3781 [Asticcacaulis excentricus CB 48]